jgi:hypothetical protein
MKNTKNREEERGGGSRHTDLKRAEDVPSDRAAEVHRGSFLQRRVAARELEVGGSSEGKMERIRDGETEKWAVQSLPKFAEGNDSGGERRHGSFGGRALGDWKWRK